MPTLQKLSIPSAHWLPSFVPVTRFKSSYTGNWYGEMRKRKMFIHRNRGTERQGKREKEKASREVDAITPRQR